MSSNNVEHDTLQRFLFENTQVRGEIMRLRASYQTVSERHDYPLPVKKLLGQTLVAAGLLSATIKFEGSLILQAQGDGLLKLLVAQSTHQYHLRGLAQWEGEIEEQSFAQAIGAGKLVITIIPNQGERYQGIVEMVGDDLASAIEGYFAQSEQLPTCLILAADDQIAAGFLLQSMPDVQTENQNNFWETVVQLAKTLTTKELLTLPNQDILHRLFHQEDVRLFDAEPVSFRCNCNLERMEQAVLLYGYEQTMEVFQTNKYVTVTCEFCNRQYDFDKVDIEKLFVQGTGGALNTTDTRH